MTGKKFIDFHTHTIYSDGIESPRTLVRNAKLSGIDVLAITDHDHTQGYYDARQEAERWNLVLIPGAEITTQDYHILGLGFNPDSKNLQDFLKYSRGLQRENCRRRVELLTQQGIPLTIEKVEAYFPYSRLGKCNITYSLLRDRECSEKMASLLGENPTHKLVFNYLFKNSACKIESEDATAKEAIDAIHEAGGRAIIAHPFKDVEDMAELESLRSLGLDGLEIQPNFGDENIPYLEYARKNNMPITYGSDYHGICFPHRPLLQRGENQAEDFLLQTELAV